jgi:large subunit ribosomal protein L32
MVPKQRHTKSRRNKRRSHHALKAINVISCPKCNQPTLAHQVCPSCGFYKNEEVIDVLAKLSKRERKQRIKEQAQLEKEKAREEIKEKSKLRPLTLEELSKK